METYRRRWIIGTAVALRCGRQVRKPPHYFLLRIVLSTNLHEMTSESNGPEYRRSLDGAGVRRISGLAISKREVRVGTWNVRSLYEAGKVDNLEQEMKRLNVDILGVSEVRWPGSGKCEREETVLYYSGSNDSKHPNGVGIMIKKDLLCNVANFIPVSDRVMLLQLKGKPININVVQIYAPTADKPDEEIETMYNELDQISRLVKKQDMNIYLGDFNAKVGEGVVPGIVGQFGLGIRNERGDRLVEFCQDLNLIVSNTWFKLPKRRLYTWKSPQDDTDRVVRNQIDYILINKRFRNAIKSVKTYPGADVNSDHNPVVAVIRLRLRRAKPKMKSKVNLRLLKSASIAEKVGYQLNQAVENIDVSDVENAWSKFKNAINMTAKDNLNEAPKMKQKWMTEEILQMMDQRRLLKDKDTFTYKELQRRIRTTVRQAREKWISTQCSEIEYLCDIHDDFNLHKKIRELTHTGRKNHASIVLDECGVAAVTNEEKCHVWEKYVQELFCDTREIRNLPAHGDNEGPPILVAEVRRAIDTAKSGKAVGPDEVNMDMFKLMNDESLLKLTAFFNSIYDSGEIPTEWLNSVFVTLPKKAGARKCCDHRTISLMSHALKILLRILHYRLWWKVEVEISDTQFGFRNAFGTREALFAMQVIVQKCLDQQCPVYACFIDFEKAFDNVKHAELVRILEEVGLDFKDVRLIRNLYWGQTAQVRVNGSLSQRITIAKGVRQGCTLSPLLFNIYSEQVFKEALGNCDIGILINGVPISNLRYADDTVLLAHTEVELQALLDKVALACRQYGLTINIAKTKSMVISKTGNISMRLVTDGQNIEQVARFKYLGQWVSETWSLEGELRGRIEVARSAFNNMRGILCRRDLSFSLRWRVVKCYIWSILLYGVETWTLKAKDINRLEAFEMWLIRRMLRIPWTARLRNEYILQQNSLIRELIITVKRRKLAYLGHIMRGSKYSLLQMIMMGKIRGRRGVGRKRASWLSNIRSWTGIDRAAELFHLAQDRQRYAEMIANLR